MPCRAHLGEVTARAADFRAIGCEVVVVTQARPDVLRMFLNKHPQPVPVVGDPELNAYRAFGLERTHWTTFLSPLVWLGFTWKLLQGYLPKSPYSGENVLQLGGDFILNRNGDLLYTYRQRNPTRRPSTRELLRAAG